MPFVSATISITLRLALATFELSRVPLHLPYTVLGEFPMRPSERTTARIVVTQVHNSPIMGRPIARRHGTRPIQLGGSAPRPDR